MGRVFRSDGHRLQLRRRLRHRKHATSTRFAGVDVIGVGDSNVVATRFALAEDRFACHDALPFSMVNAQRRSCGGEGFRRQ